MSLLARLEGLLGKGGLLADDDARQRYGQDWTRFAQPAPLAVALPKDTREVQAIVQLARAEGLALVPSGGRTGLSGGAVAAEGELLVSLERMNAIGDFNPVDLSVQVQAGVITQTLQDFATSQGLCYPVDFASSGSSHIGGNIATNAGGVKVLGYGHTRNWVAGLTVVAGTGEILELNAGLVKNATGYDLRHLFIGSEGTLGFITEACIRLMEAPGPLAVALMALPRMAGLTSVFLAFRERLALTSFEFFTAEALGHVLAASDLPPPFAEPSPCYALAEFPAAAQADAEAAFAACMEAGWAADGVLSQSEQQRANFWQYRERISESISHLTPYKNDLAVLPSAVPDFLAAVEKVVGRVCPDFAVLWFGHIGDGNLHLNILKPEGLDTAEFKRQCETASDAIMQEVQRFRGSVSAEHGIGLLKKGQLHYTRPPEEIALMRAVKQAFDPDGIMNPGKLLPS